MWEQVDNAIQGLQMILSWGPILALCVGILIGFVVGAIPGLTVTMTIAMLMPITFELSPLLGIPMCIGIWKAGLYAGAIPAILVSTPGTGGAVATMLDGNPMAKQGLATKALQTSLVASTFGDAFSDVMLLIFMAPIAMIALLFGAPEYFALYFMSLVLIAALVGQSVVKGLFSAFLGLLISTVGIEAVTG
ncbi:MAG: C4-dicarboxylate ABC transporter permease, partial [Lysobacterales bacterium]